MCGADQPACTVLHAFLGCVKPRTDFVIFKPTVEYKNESPHQQAAYSTKKIER